MNDSGSSDEVSTKNGKGLDKKTTACKRKVKKQRTPKVPVKRRMLKKAEISDIKNLLTVWLGFRRYD